MECQSTPSYVASVTQWTECRSPKAEAGRSIRPRRTKIQGLWSGDLLLRVRRPKRGPSSRPRSSIGKGSGRTSAPTRERWAWRSIGARRIAIPQVAPAGQRPTTKAVRQRDRPTSRTVPFCIPTFSLCGEIGRRTRLKSLCRYVRHKGSSPFAGTTLYRQGRPMTTFAEGLAFQSAALSGCVEHAR